MDLDLNIKYATITAQMPWREAREVKMLARSEGLTLSEFMRRAIRREVNRFKPQPK